MSQACGDCYASGCHTFASRGCRYIIVITETSCFQVNTLKGVILSIEGSEWICDHSGKRRVLAIVEMREKRLFCV